MNRIALLGLLVLSAGCAGSLERAVDTANDQHRYPSGMSVVYDDRAPLLGGDRIEIAADGRIAWWSEPPSPLLSGSAPEDAFDDREALAATPERAPDRTGTADAAAMTRLAELLDAIAPWDGSPDDENDARLERRRALLEVRVGDDAASTWQWADPTETGDARITSIRRWAETRVHLPEPTPTPETSGGEEPAENVGPNPVLR